MSKIRNIIFSVLVIAILGLGAFTFLGLTNAYTPTVIYSNSCNNPNLEGFTGNVTSTVPANLLESLGIVNVDSYGDAYTLCSQTLNYVGNGGQAYAYQYLGVSYGTFCLTELVYWESGYPSSTDAQGGVIGGFGNVYSGANDTPIIYNNGSAYVWAIRVYSSSTYTDYYSNVVVNMFQWYTVSFLITPTTATLYLNGSSIIAQTGLSLTTDDYAMFGNTYNSQGGVIFYINRVVVSNGYYGEVLTQNPYETGYTTLLNSTTNMLQYPYVANGYLYVVSSHGSPQIAVYTTPNNNLVMASALNNSIYEAFQPFVLNGYIFIPATSGNGGVAGCLTVLNATNLEQILFINETGVNCNYLTSACYDNYNNAYVFGCDMLGNELCILQVPQLNVTNLADYTFVNVAVNPNYGIATGSETTVCTFNNSVYVCATSGHTDGYNGKVETQVYENPYLTVGTWSLVLDETGTNTASGAYFGHISATNNYIVVGLVSSSGTGTTTYRFEYSNDGINWNEYDTGVLEDAGENHANVNAINGNLFILELSERGNTLVSHNVYAFDASIGSIRYLFTVYSSIGYDDRWAGLDTVNNNIYLADCYASAASSQIIEINWSGAFSNAFPVSTLYYFEDINPPIQYSNNNGNTGNSVATLQVSSLLKGSQNYVTVGCSVTVFDITSNTAYTTATSTIIVYNVTDSLALESDTLIGNGATFDYFQLSNGTILQTGIPSQVGSYMVTYTEISDLPTQITITGIFIGNNNNSSTTQPNTPLFGFNFNTTDLIIAIYILSIGFMCYVFYAMHNNNVPFAFAVGIIIATIICQALKILGIFTYPIDAIVVVTVLASIFFGRNGRDK